MKEFGVSEYESAVYINFDNNKRMKALFEGSMEVERLITGLELYAGHKIDPDNALLIFDEVQEVPRVLTSLKKTPPGTKLSVPAICWGQRSTRGRRSL